MLSKGRSDIVTTGNDLTLRDGYSDQTTIRTGANVAARVLTLPVTTGNDTLVSNTSTSILTNKTFTDPVLGAATATSINKVAITAPATSATLTIADGKTLTLSNTLTFTGTDSSSVAFGAGGTVIYASNKLSALSATTSAELAGVISDKTGSGSLVFADTPTLVTPVLGVASATSINKVALTAPATSATLTIADGKTLTCSNTLTFTGTDASSVAFGTGGTVLYSGGALGTPSSGTLTNCSGLPIAGIASLGTGVAAALAANVTGSDGIVLATSPSLTTPTLGVASATSINKVAITAPATGSTLTIADGKTLTLSNTLTFTGTDSSSVAFGTGGTVAYTANKLSAFAATTSSELAGVISDETGSGALVFGTAPTISAPVVDQANFTQAASATTPAVGKSAVYVNSGDGKIHIVDSSGNDSAVGSGGAGARNYLSDWFDGIKSVGSVTNSTTATGNVTISTTAWQASDTSKLTVANVTSAGIRGDAMTNSGAKSLKLDHVAVGVAFVQSPNFQLDLVDVGKPVSVSFDHGAVTTADDYQVYIVRYASDGTYGEQIRIAGTASATSPYSARMAAGSTTTFRGFFVAGSTSTDYYALRFYRNNASDTTDISIDSLYVGPQTVTQGAAVTDPVSFTPTWTNLSNISSQAWEWWRQGKYMGIKGYVKLSGAVAGEIAFTIPGGYSMDTTSILTSGQNSELGNVTYTDSGTTNAYGTVTYGSATTLKFIGNSSSVWNATAPITWAANDVISFTALVPIANWSSNVTMANRAVEEYASNSSTSDASDTTSFAYGPRGSQFPSVTTTNKSKRVRFQTPIQATDKIDIEIYWNGSWQHISNTGLQAVNSTTLGMSIDDAIVGSTDVDVVFGSAGYPASPATSAGAWTTIDLLDTYKWRVRKVSGGAAVGYPISSENIVIPYNSTNYTGFSSGTYTPTITNGTNVAASSNVNAFYQRIGNIVYVSGAVNIDPTSALTNTLFTLSLPVARTSTSTFFTIGTSSGNTPPDIWSGSPASTTADFKGYPASASNQTVSFSFMYNIA